MAEVIHDAQHEFWRAPVPIESAGGIAASFPECIGENYQDGSGTRYLSLRFKWRACAAEPAAAISSKRWEA